MKTIWTVAAALTLGGAIGCEESSTPTSTTGTNRGVMGTNTGTSATPTPATTTGNAWENAADTAAESLAAARAKIDELAARAANATGEAKDKIEANVRDLRERSTGIDDRIAEMRTNAANKWEEIRDDVSTRMAELNKKIDEAFGPG